MHASLPPPLIGFDTGTLEVQRWVPHLKDPALLESAHLRFHTSSGTHRVKENLGAGVGDDSSSSSEEEEEASDKSILLPVRGRYRSALFLRLKKSGLVHRGTVGLGVIWLRDLADNTSITVRVKVWKAEDYKFIKHNYVALDVMPEDIEQGKVEQLGEIELTLCFRPGISDTHHKLLLHDNPKAWEEYVALKDAGWRDIIGQTEGHPDQDEQQEHNTVVDPEAVDGDDRADDESMAPSQKSGCEPVRIICHDID